MELVWGNHFSEMSINWRSCGVECPDVLPDKLVVPDSGFSPCFAAGEE